MGNTTGIEVADYAADERIALCIRQHRLGLAVQLRSEFVH